MVIGAKGIISNAMQELKATWYKDSTVIGTGESPSLSANNVTSGLLGVDMTDKGNYKILTTSDGKAILASADKVIIAK